MTLNSADFFNRFWQAFEKAGHKAVILHSWKQLPEGLDSDVDFAVTGLSPRDLLRWVFDFTEENGWRLAQVIEHEPRALYMVCIQAEAPFESMALDVIWDYRRLGHVLVPSKILMNGRRQPENKSFHVPAPGAEFCYILAKSAAKGKRFREVRGRLDELLQEDKQDCLIKAGQVFENPFPLTGDESSIIEDLGVWFESAECFRQVRAGHRYGWDEILMYWQRIFHPTGVWLQLPGRSAQEPQSTRLAEILGPLFRQVEREDRISGTALLATWVKTIRARGICEYPGSRVGGFSGRWVIHEEGEDAAKQIIERLASRIRSRIGA